jgi:hypothetical protein
VSTNIYYKIALELDLGKHWHETFLVVAGAVVGALGVSWWMTGDPFAFVRTLFGGSATRRSAAAITNPDILESYIPREYIYSPYPEDYPMYPQYVERPYANIADDFTAQHGYLTRPYQRSYHANQVVDNHESWDIVRDHDGNIIGISGSRNVNEW